MILVVDNYDSFTFNLVQALQTLGAEMEVHRNDEIGVDESVTRVVALMRAGGYLG